MQWSWNPVSMSAALGFGVAILVFVVALGREYEKTERLLKRTLNQLGVPYSPELPSRTLLHLKTDVLFISPGPVAFAVAVLLSGLLPGSPLALGASVLLMLIGLAALWLTFPR